MSLVLVKTSQQSRVLLAGLHLASFDEQDQFDLSAFLGALPLDPDAATVFVHFRHVEVPRRSFGRSFYA